MRRIVILGVASLVVLSGCGGEPTLDTSSEQAVEQSGKALLEALPEEQQEALAMALMAHTMAGMAERDCKPDADPVCAIEHLDGMNANEIIDSASDLGSAMADMLGSSLQEGMREARESAQSRQRQRDDARLADLQQRKEAAQDASETLSKLEIENATFSIRETRFRDEAIIALTFTNTLDKAIAKVYMNGIYQTPGRSVPWLEDTFNYQIPGGVEPGETVQWRLSPNTMSAWSRQEEIDGARLRIEVEKVVFADGTEIDATVFRDRHRERLEELLTH